MASTFFCMIYFCIISSLCLISVLGEITILGSVQTIYDRSPKLRIRGAGFDAEDHDITLDLAAPNSPSLRVDKDFMISKDPQGEGLILKLLNLRRWVNLDERVPPVALILSGVYFNSAPSKNLLPEPKIVAQVLLTPDVYADDRVMYQTASSALNINGTGFMGAKKVDFFFNPPLLNEIAYEVVTPFPLSRNIVQLRLRHGYKWRETPGELRIVGVDTGGGPVKLNGAEGIMIGNVQSDLESHSVSVEDTSEEQSIYFDQPEITIRGRGFNPDGTKLRFSNGIMGAGVNYTTVSITEDRIRLRLQAGSTWRRNVENLPGYLTLLAINNGGPDGWVPVGPMNSGKGKDIATVFETPSVHSSSTKLYRTHSHELHLDGKGFVRVLQTNQIKFDPPLTLGVDYEMKQINRDDLEITLKDGKEWRSTPGPLKVLAINTRGVEDGWVNIADGDGVHVADIVSDVDSAFTGGVEVYPRSTRIYQSALQRELEISGSGFKQNMKLHLEPALMENIDYTMDIQGSNKVVVTLVSGRKWSKEAGFLIVKAVTIGGQKYPLAGDDGVRVAVVFADPVINSGTGAFHETQSKVISIDGTGFTNAADMKVTVRPTTPGSYKILGVNEDTVRLQLKPDFDWLPSFLSLADEAEDKKIPLQVTAVDSGAGEIEYDFPITVGYIVKDREGVVCDDSCEFAFDGICDDGTETEYYYEYEYYGYYLDDDMGGYYYVGDDAYEESYDDADDAEGEEAEDDDAEAEADAAAGEDDDEEGGEGEEYYDDYGDTGHREGYYAYAYDDYYAADDAYTVSACLEGTDCTDCGGVDAIVDYSKAPAADSGVEACTNTCPYARDGICDDPRGANYCELGTDCQDCGALGNDNFTRIDDDGWWDDDDDYWTFNDGTFLDQAKGLEANRHRVKVTSTVDSAGPAAMFLIVLEGMVYAVGGVFAAIALYLGMRIYNGQSLPFMQAFNPEEAAIRDLENAPVRKMAITPDVIRT